MNSWSESHNGFFVELYILDLDIHLYVWIHYKSGFTILALTQVHTCEDLGHIIADVSKHFYHTSGTWAQSNNDCKVVTLPTYESYAIVLGQWKKYPNLSPW